MGALLAAREGPAFDLNPEQCQKSCDNVSFTNQNSKSELSKSIGEKTYDVILDDGGHSMKQQMNTLEVYWPHVNPGGVFIMEDLHTSNPWNKYKKFKDAETTTVEHLFTNPPGGMKDMRCNFSRDKPTDHMTCILYKQ